jgi:hypothetical protein
MFDLGRQGFPRVVMMKVLKQKIWWLAIVSAGASQHGEVGASAVAVIAAILLKTIAHAIWLTLPQLWRKWLRDELASSRTRIQTDERTAALWRPAASPKTVRVRTKPANSQEHYHAYS